MSDALFNRSIVLPQRNNLENSMQLMCKNNNIINPPLFPLEYLSYGESFKNFNKPNNWTGIARIALAWASVKQSLTTKIVMIALSQWAGLSDYIQLFIGECKNEFGPCDIDKMNHPTIFDILQGKAKFMGNPKFKALSESLDNILMEVRNSITPSQRDDYLWKQLNGTWTNMVTNNPETLSDLNKTYIMRYKEFSTQKRFGIGLTEAGVCAINQVLNNLSMFTSPLAGFSAVWTDNYNYLIQIIQLQLYLRMGK